MALRVQIVAHLIPIGRLAQGLVLEVQDEEFVVDGQDFRLLAEHYETFAEAGVPEGRVPDLDLRSAIVSQLHNVRLTEERFDLLDNASHDIDKSFVVLQKVFEFSVEQIETDQGHLHWVDCVSGRVKVEVVEVEEYSMSEVLDRADAISRIVV